MTDDIRAIVLMGDAYSLLRKITDGLSSPATSRALDELLRENLVARDYTGTDSDGFEIRSSSVRITERGAKFLALHKALDKELRRTNRLSIYAAVTATIAILIELVRLFRELWIW